MSQHDVTREHISRSESKSTCFLVYSTRESHSESVVKRLVDLLSNDLNFSVVKLDEARIAGRPLLSEILNHTKECDLGIVILDGLRPNILLELGMLLANRTPCIVLLERTAHINIKSLISDTGKLARQVPHIKIDISKHISDISNISWNEYSLENDVEFRALIRKEISKLIPQITRNRAHNHRDYAPKIESLLRRIDDAEKLAPEKYARLVLEARKAIQSLGKGESAHIYFHIARSLFSRNEYQKALKEVVRGLAISPTSDSLLNLRGVLLFELGQREEGMRIFRRLFLKNPNRKSVQHQYFHALNVSDSPKVVLKILSKMTYESLVINDLIPIKAHSLFLTRDFIGSIELLLELYEYDSNQWAIQQAMYVLSSSVVGPLSESLVERIEKNIKRAIDHGHIKCHDCFFGGCLEANLTTQAQKILILWYRSNRLKDAGTLNKFAYNFMELGDYKKAKAILRPALKKYPNDSYLNATLGMYKLKVECNLSEGKKLYEKAIDLRPDDLPLKRMYYYQVGSFYRHRNNMAEARNNYELALAVRTDDRQSLIRHALKTLRNQSRKR